MYILGSLYADTLKIALLIVSCILYTITCCTDFVDGHIARKTGTVSELGKFLDPLADKMVIIVMLFLVVFFNGRQFEIFPGYGLTMAILGGLVLCREQIISVFRTVAGRKGVVMAADIYGKAKTMFLDFGVGILLMGGIHMAIAWVGSVLFFIGAFLAVFSAFNYMIKNKHVLKDDGESAEEEKAETTVES
jgi:CDP-diacylglycerol--glycerol-3-phosphate 3-phosphatidyltransferase